MTDEQKRGAVVPFDATRLDDLLGERDIDVLVATSAHNVQYLLGGYRFFFFHTINAVGVSRYLPIVVYLRGRPEATFYVGQGMERPAPGASAFRVPGSVFGSWGSADAMEIAVERLKTLGAPIRRIGIEAAFLPVDAQRVLQAAFESAEIVDALRPLERLRAVKTPEELNLLRKVSEGVADSVIAAFGRARPGMTKHDIERLVHEEQFAHGIEYNCCQIAFGPSFDRVPSAQALRPGEVVSLDSVGGLDGYLGDLCRMGVAGKADAELEDVLAEIDAVQQAARKAVRVGVAGGDLIAAGDAVVAQSPHRSTTDFTVHGMGLVLHEAPRLARGRPVPYPADDASLPLEPGMVLSIETSVRHPTRGFIKLEDTVAVTVNGGDAFSDYGRGWNSIGA